MSLISTSEPELDPAAEWWSGAACRTMDPDLFFPPEPDVVSLQAQVACDGCPVRSDCLDWAIRHEHYGIWGGTSPDQRAKLRKTLHIRAHPPTRLDPWEARLMFERGNTVEHIAAVYEVGNRTVYRLLGEAGLRLTPPPR